MAVLDVSETGLTAVQLFNRILTHAEEHRVNILHVFYQADKDNSGGLQRAEFGRAMRSLGVSLSEAEVRQVMDELDGDGDGFISIRDFAHRLQVAKRDRRAEIDVSDVAEESQPEPEPEPDPEPKSEPEPEPEPRPGAP